MDYKKSKAPVNTVTRNIMDLCEETGNIYESVAIIAKRANQISVEIKQDLNKKLAEFASYNDSLEEVFENREQIEISRYYEACIITSQNALKDYPYTKLREKFALLVMKSKFELAQQSVEEKKLERFQDAEDECYGFINEYPDSKNKSMAEKFISKCKEVTKD